MVLMECPCVVRQVLRLRHGDVHVLHLVREKQGRVAALSVR